MKRTLIFHITKNNLLFLKRLLFYWINFLFSYSIFLFFSIVKWPIFLGTFADPLPGQPVEHDGAPIAHRWGPPLVHRVGPERGRQTAAARDRRRVGPLRTETRFLNPEEISMIPNPRNIYLNDPEIRFPPPPLKFLNCFNSYFSLEVPYWIIDLKIKSLLKKHW